MRELLFYAMCSVGVLRGEGVSLSEVGLGASVIAAESAKFASDLRDAEMVCDICKLKRTTCQNIDDQLLGAVRGGASAFWNVLASLRLVGSAERELGVLGVCALGVQCAHVIFDSATAHKNRLNKAERSRYKKYLAAASDDELDRTLGVQARLKKLAIYRFIIALLHLGAASQLFYGELSSFDRICRVSVPLLSMAKGGIDMWRRVVRFSQLQRGVQIGERVADEKAAAVQWHTLHKVPVDSCDMHA